jgi:hypothetical protein
VYFDGILLIGEDFNHVDRFKLQHQMKISDCQQLLSKPQQAFLEQVIGISLC